MAAAQSIVEWLDKAGEEWPERVAVEDTCGKTLRYGDCAKWSTMLAAQLRARGISPGARIGVFMRKSTDAVLAFQAILRCGAAYVPADPDAPASRAALS